MKRGSGKRVASEAVVTPTSLRQRARRIEIASQRLVNEQLAGQYQSLFKGRGLIFSDVRPYYHGDDVRAIDWNVSARMNAPHVKQFVEERDRTVNIVVDVSASTDWGSFGSTKRQMAAELAAVLAFAAIRNHDRVGLYLVSDRVERYVPPAKGRRHVLRLIAELLSYQPVHSSSSLGAAFDMIGKISKRRSLVFAVSDFLPTAMPTAKPDEGRAPPAWESALRILAQRHEVVCAVVTDRLEQALPAVGLVEMQDLETGEVALVDTGGAAAAYQRQATRWGATRDTALRRANVSAVTVRTDQDYLAALVRFFAERVRVKARRVR